MSTFRFFKKDLSLKPVLSESLQVNGAPVNLTGATVQLRWKDNVNTINPAQLRTATIIDPIYGSVEYDWLPGEPGESSEYLFEWIITFTGGSTMILPDDGYSLIEITPVLT